MFTIVKEHSISSNAGGISQMVSTSTTSVQSAAINSDSVVIYCTEDTFFREGINPTALSTGVDQIIPAGAFIRLCGIGSGNKLAFVTTGASGKVYITAGT